jgi:hypothetical protein
MKLLYVEIARTIWLFDASTLNPQGLSLDPMLKGINERYGFAKSPKNALDFNSQGALAFEQGSFNNSQGKAVAVTLTIYSDGLVADTQSNTRDATEFLNELCASATKEFGLVDPSSGTLRTGFFSQLDVRFDKPLISLNPKLEAILEMLEAQCNPVDTKRRKFTVGGIGIWTEDMSLPGSPAAFRLERKWGTPWDTNHYFSTAPLETNDHLQVLTEIEKILP